MRVTDLDHIVLNVSDTRRALDFYVGVLGLEGDRIAEWEAGEILFPSVRINDHSIIDLLETERTGTNADHFCLVIEDDIDELVEAGTFDVVSGPSYLYGARGEGYSIYINDPDGNLVELRNYR